MVRFLQHQSQRFTKVHKGLVWRYEGLFLVERRVGNLDYQLKLPKHLEMHPRILCESLKTLSCR